MPLLFEYRPGMSITDMGGTFTRATTATYYDRNGVVQTAASGALRDAHYLNGVRYTLLEKASTNDILQSSFEDGSSGAAAGTSPPTVSNSTEQAFHGTKSVKVVWTGASSAFGDMNVGFSQSQWTSMPNGAKGAWTAYVKGPAGVTVRMLITGTAGMVDSGDVTLTGTWQRIAARVTNSTGSAQSVSIFFYAPSGAFTMYVDAIQLEKNTPYETSYIPTTTGAVARNAEELYFSWPFAPQVKTAYIRGIVLFGSADDAQAFLALTDAANNVPRWMVWHDGDATPPDNRIRSYHETSAGVVVNSAGSITNPAFAQEIEIRSTFKADGKVNTHLSIAGAAELSGNESAPLVPGVAWPSPTRLYIGRGFNSTMAFAFRSLCIMAGEKTMAEMRAPRTFIRFEDSFGVAYLENTKPFPANRFQNWTPDPAPFGHVVARQSDGAETMFRLRDDYTVSFELPHIPSRPVENENPLDIAQRFVYHLQNGGKCIVETGDAVGTSYVCGRKPGTKPSLTRSDPRTMEYTLSVQLLNLGSTPTSMGIRYAEQ